MRFAPLLLAICLTGIDSPDGEVASEKQLKLSRIVDTPDLTQRQTRLPVSGSAYCAPASVSNAFVWLSKQGYPRLLDNSLANGDQIELARVLGTPEFMDTDPADGTGPNGLINGVRKYVTRHGYRIARLETQGWRVSNRSAAARSRVRHANLDWAARELQRKAVVLLNVGWYSKDGSTYHRHGGHWVVMVGAKQEPDGYTILIRDSQGRSKVGAHEKVVARQVVNGILEGDQKQLPLSAQGAWELGGELRISSSGQSNTSILDAIVLLELE